MKILGIIDIFSALVLLGIAADLTIPQGLIITISIYLIGKGLCFFILSFDIGSIIDSIIGILLLLTFFFNIPIIVLIIAVIFEGMKGLVSLFCVH